MSKKEKLKIKNQLRGEQKGDRGTKHGKSHYTDNSGNQNEYSTTSLIDVSLISDPQLVVIFKGLQKRDPTTKEKAVDNLTAYINDSDTEFDESILAVWVQFFPYLATEVSRKLRISAFKIQGELFKTFRKHSAKYVRECIGPWLAGLYDTDKFVARAAVTAFETVFTSDEKRKQVFEIFHVELLEYVLATLSTRYNHATSDNKYFTQTDLDLKAFREKACSVALFSYLLGQIPPSAINEQQEYYAKIITSEGIWVSISSQDSHLSRALAYDYTDWLKLMTKYLGRYLISNGLINISISAIPDFLDTIAVITRLYPQSWRPDPRANEPSLSLLLSFISNGSRYAGHKFWNLVNVVIESLPSFTLDLGSPVVSSFEELAIAFIKGISAEQRISVDAAFEAYFSMIAYVNTVSTSTELQKHAFNKAEEALDQYLLVLDPLGTKVGTETAARSITAYFRKTISIDETSSLRLWNHVINLISTSILEEKDEEKEKIIVSNFIALALKVSTISSDITDRIDFAESIWNLTNTSIDAVKSSTGSHKAAVLVLESLVKNLQTVIKSSPSLYDDLTDFVENSVPDLILSESYTRIVNIWINYEGSAKSKEQAQKVYSSIIESIFTSSIPEKTNDILLELVKSSKLIKNLLSPSTHLEEYILQRSSIVFEAGTKQDWELLLSSITGSGYIISEKTSLEALTIITQAGLTDDNRQDDLLKYLVRIAENDLLLLSKFIKTEEGNKLVSRIWHITEFSDPSSPANQIHQKLESQLGTTNTTEEDAGISVFESLTRALLRDVENNLEVSLDALISRSISLWDRAQGDLKSSLANALLFIDSWGSILARGFSWGISRSLPPVNSIGGASYLVIETEAISHEIDFNLFRIGLYVLQLTSQIDVFKLISHEKQVQLFTSLQLFSELAKDAISESGNSPLPSLFYVTNERLKAGWDDWAKISSIATVQLKERLKNYSLTQIETSTFDPAASKEGKDGTNFIQNILYILTSSTTQNTVRGFYSARILRSIISELSEHLDVNAKVVEEFITTHKLRRAADTLATVAIYEGLSTFMGTISLTDRLRNELASDIIGLRAGPKIKAETLRKIILLNSLVHNIDNDGKLFPPQRAIMLLRKLLDIFPNEENISLESVSIRSETTKLLVAVLLDLKSLYGEHWNFVISFVGSSLSYCLQEILNDAATPLLYYSLRLFTLLNSIQDLNEDIQDSLADDIIITESILEILDSSIELEQRSSARVLCDDILAGIVKALPLSKLGDSKVLFNVLSVDSEALQDSILFIEEQRIARAQEELAIEAALDTHGVLTIELPVELLSLVMTIPSKDADNFGNKLTSSLRGYLYSWILIFEHFNNATFAVKSKYVENLKEGDYVPDLIGFVFESFGLDQPGKPFDVSKISSIQEYRPGESVDSYWLLSHVYYLTLKHVPSIVRKWYSEIRNRQLSIAVENFTQKFFSPLLIDSELTSVQVKVSEANVQAHDENMTVKVSKITKEVLAVYVIDDQTMEMAIRVPQTFPLQDVIVDGIKRVGVKENQWRAWLLASQAVITSQNGTIVDALSLFRRNVSLNFEGVTECAICYSILHQDRSLPNKRCQTCKNKFHAGCLYKWFQSANSNSCPLCRQLFTFTR
ncbi:hypothetical protein V1514DRAFT_346298 [Lipomyces japonicus]|uniref:uncharacterized protein n=1 Tax=Lipomyces japonicus TaxID=56871 RepID=UPI0034CD3E72